MDYATLQTLKSRHTGWKLLCSDHAPLIISFLNRVFIEPNVRVVSAADLSEALEDELYLLRQQAEDNLFPKSGQQYLDDWASPDKGWLRKFYSHDSDEPQYDLTSATENVVSWVNQLTGQSFVGTESRLLTLFELLKQMSEGSETDPARRIAELHRRKEEIDIEISKVLAGDMGLLGDTALKDRFQQFMQLSRELLSDFREVEQNFRQLDRRVRERITLWEGSKGALLEEIMGERDIIANSDQGRSFNAFWDFLMSSNRQEELSTLLAHVLSLAPIEELQPDKRIKRIHYDWLEAGEHTQRTVAQLSQQLKRFLDDKAWLENRRIMDILHNIETKALAIRGHFPEQEFMVIDAFNVDVELPFERPLFTPKQKPVISQEVIQASDEDVDTTALYSQVFIDKARLIRHIHQALLVHSQITLHELTQVQPLQQGLAELITYLQVGSDKFKTIYDESMFESITWSIQGQQGEIVYKQAKLPRVIYMKT